VIVALALALTPRANACGGMFCNAAQPVEQAAERIVFAWAEDDACPEGLVTVEVQISYVGEAADFGWVVPVPDVPELFASTDVLFTALANPTVPTFSIQQESYGTCGGGGIGCAQADMVMTEQGFAGDGGGDTNLGGVNVISSQTVGPYETVVLQATGAAFLLAWLEDEAFAVPSDIEPVLAPYLADHQYFVALKLASGADVGDIAPLGMTYCGDSASIPIQLTSIAAVDDLPIEVFVLGPTRAVPDNYLHVRINEAAIDWYTGGTNYRDVVKRAVDEAGGQAFVTDFSGSGDMFAATIWSESMIDLDRLRAIDDLASWIDAIVTSGMPGGSQLLAFLGQWAPKGVDPVDFVNCPSCYKLPAQFDAVATTDAFEEAIVEPLRDAQDLVDDAVHVTRLFTTMDPEEMTVDPQFVFNADVEQEVAFAHTATDEQHCGFLEGRDNAEHVLRLVDGRAIALPSSNWLIDQDMTQLEYMAELASPAAIVVEDLGQDGPGDLIADYRETAAAEADATGGCGPASGQGVVAPGLLFLAGLVLKRRRG
jgi:hypothetical protein